MRTEMRGKMTGKKEKREGENDRRGIKTQTEKRGGEPERTKAKPASGNMLTHSQPLSPRSYPPPSPTSPM
jgi:hypothetical protein